MCAEPERIDAHLHGDNSQNFYRIELPWLDSVLPNLRRELQENDSLWLVDEGRQNRISVQRHTQSIFLRRALRPRLYQGSMNDVHASGPARMASQFPCAIDLLHRIANALEGDLGRALYVRLLPNCVVYPHVDEGSYYAVRNRYHLVIQSPEGSLLRCEEEEVRMQEGEIWWFDNKKMHSSKNLSSEMRTHLIFDLLPSDTTPPKRANLIPFVT